jgi:AraC-like DNA-binding protein
MTGASIFSVVAATILLSWQRYRTRRNQELLNLRIDMLMAREKELTRKYQDAITDQPAEIVESRDLQMLKKALDVVENHLSDTAFGVEKLAEELNMSRANLHKRLKSMTGISPSDFIRSVRLKRAAHMLRGNADNVAQIGYAVGFEDQSYFTKSFKKYFGVAPSDYARQALQPENELAR